MAKLKAFLLNTLLGGLVVVLPIALMAFLIVWVVRLLSDLVAPVAGHIATTAAIKPWIATVLALAILLGICFFMGLVVRTRIGGWLLKLIEDSLLRRIPGYSLIRETIAQFLGAKQSPFSKVAMAAPYDNRTLVSCFVTDTHDNGWYTVFVPTGPNPTSGNMFHLPPERVHIVAVSVENAMRSIISCGAGSAKLIKALEPEQLTKD